MSGFTGRRHTEEAKARIGAASRARGPHPNASSPETRAKQRAAKLGRVYSESHRAAISAGLRRWSAAASVQERLGGRLATLSDAEARDYLAIVRKKFSRAEALRMIGREELIEAKRRTP